jgi:hypothetical protein
MREAYYVGLALAKNIFQIFTADEKGREIGMYRPAPRVKVFFEFSNQMQSMYPASFTGYAPVPMMKSALWFPINRPISCDLCPTRVFP